MARSLSTLFLSLALASSAVAATPTPPTSAADALARQFAEQSETLLQTPVGQEGAKLGASMKRRMDKLAGEAAQAERSRNLEFAGLSAEEPSSLIYLVSWSMPIEMLRSYALEARWSGGHLVFKGTPPDKTLLQNLAEDYLELSEKNSEMDAPVSIDPRYFDMFNVTTAPAIILVDNMDELECAPQAPIVFKSNLKKTLRVRRCAVASDKGWWKVTGALTTGYALRVMAEAGSATASRRLKVFQDRAAGKIPSLTAADGKSMQPYTGKWEKALSKEEALQQYEAARKAQREEQSRQQANSR